ncbi:NAD(P)/FAD-dependent oxidoreductase [Ornithinibacillus sp. JPR2-1]|uniref:NAD(P)/FAD-dependent oxidoreductase n=1 Tax=Ornithinibacillus sp. JPR2-1 TaxID=2094019 RepID=UPI0031DF77B6
MMSNDIFDVTIVGGGPAGLFAAFYSGIRNMKTKIIDFQPHLGGKVHIYPEKMIWDVGGLTPVTGAKLIDQIVEQGLTFNPTVVLNAKVESIQKLDDGQFLLTESSGKEHLSQTVIIATGSGILRPQKINIKGAERFEISNLHYTIKSLRKFKDKTVLISGGGNTAIDWANELEPIARKVYLTYRKDEEHLKGHEAQIIQLLNSSAECLFHTSITNFLANKNQDKIEYVELHNDKTSEAIQLEVDHVLINHGFDQDISLIKNSPLDINLIDDFYIEGTSMSETSIPGLFAAGDILKHDGKLHLIAGAFQDAANAVNRAKLFIEPKANEMAMVSSHNEVFEERNKDIIKKLVK